MGAVFTAPSVKYLHFAGGKGDMYDAVSKKTTSFSVGENKARAESFLTLGFGGSGKDLQQAWTVTLQGTETVDGTAATKFDLVPKDPSVGEMFTHVTIWLDLTRGVSLKQIFYTPEGDTRTSYYTHIRYNTSIDTKKYATPKH
jgi:outer membrane lipoprotein-sorting protein